MKTKFYYLTFRDGTSKQYEVVLDSIKSEGEFITFESVNPYFPKETNIHSINTRNVNSIDYYDSIVDLVSNIEPKSDTRTQSPFSKEFYFLLIFDLFLLALIFLLNR